MLDIFNDSMFDTISLTLALEQLPNAPTKIGDMGLFRFEGITGTTVVIENKSGVLTLIPSAARGTMPTWNKREGRNVRAFNVTHLPLNDTILADDVQGKRAFGSDDAVESVVQLVNSRMERLKLSMQMTFEWHRLGALRGEVLDADLTTVLYNWFDEWDVTQETVDFDFAEAGDNVLLKALDVIELIESALAGMQYDHIHAFVGKQWWRNMLANAEIKDAMRDVNDNEFARSQRQAFDFGNITWEPYRGSIGGEPFIADDEALFFPVGVQDLFIHYGAPAPFMETVNTVGRDMYAKQERMKFDMGVELHVDSSPLFMCTRPAALVKGSDTTVMALRAPKQPQEEQPQEDLQGFEPQAVQ